MNKSGYIYILTNKSFKDNYIKIGYSVDVERRVRELSSSGLPYDYEIYCTYEILASQKNSIYLESIPIFQDKTIVSKLLGAQNKATIETIPSTSSKRT